MSYDKIRCSQLLNQYRDDLLNNTVPFWLERCPDYLDKKYGGYQHIVNAQGAVIDSDKSVWAQGRNAWLWATLYNDVRPHQPWREAAELGIRFLDEHGFDPADGRMWFHVARDGTPIRKRRYAFSEVFASIAYGSWAHLTGSSQYADKAAACLKTFIEHQPEAKFTGNRPSIGLSQSLIEIATAQSLRKTFGYDQADAIIDRAIDRIETCFVKDDLQVVLEQVSPDGSVIEHLDGRTLNPGHAIEAAWFILDEAIHRGRDARLIALGCRMIDYMWQRGWDREYGGILYFTDLHHGQPQEYWHDMKFWWPHNETIIATLMAWLLTGDQKYAQWHSQVHDWAHAHFPDREHGEWFGYLRRDGKRSNDAKGTLWKSPFHLPRMQLKCWKVLEQFEADTSGR